MASCPPIYAWADNIQHMDPCEVASSLMDVCDSSLPPLQPIINHEDTYRGPTTKLQSSCLCSSVIYALVSACSDCQGGLIESWPTWSRNCTSPLVDSFDGPLPANISVPAWAYFDVNSDPLYSPSAASSSAAALQATSTFTTASATAAEAVAAEILPTSTSTSQTTSTTRWQRLASAQTRPQQPRETERLLSLEGLLQPLYSSQWVLHSPTGICVGGGGHECRHLQRTWHCMGLFIDWTRAGRDG